MSHSPPTLARSLELLAQAQPVPADAEVLQTAAGALAIKPADAYVDFRSGGVLTPEQYARMPASSRAAGPGTWESVWRSSATVAALEWYHSDTVGPQLVACRNLLGACRAVLAQRAERSDHPGHGPLANPRATLVEQIDAALAVTPAPARPQRQPQPQPQDQPLSTLQASAPERIYLCVSDERHHYDEPFPSGDEAGGVTWADDAPVECVVPYVRADLAGPDGREAQEATAQEQ